MDCILISHFQVTLAIHGDDENKQLLEYIYCKIFNISGTKSKNLNDLRLVLH